MSKHSERVVRQSNGRWASKKNVFERFEEKVQKTNTCWIWTGLKSEHGYGRFEVRGQFQIGAHRASYILFVGDIPEGMLVCHKCDNPPCVNPDHLFVGTVKDNVRDMIAKGRDRFNRKGGLVRGPRSECNKGHSLTGENVMKNGPNRTCRICYLERRKRNRQQEAA